MWIQSIVPFSIEIFFTGLDTNWEKWPLLDFLWLELEIRLLGAPISRLSGLLCLTDGVMLVAVTAIRMNKLTWRMVHFIIAPNQSPLSIPVGEAGMGGDGAVASMSVSVDPPVDSLLRVCLETFSGLSSESGALCSLVSLFSSY